MQGVMALGALQTRSLMLLVAALGSLAVLFAAGPTAESAQGASACKRWGSKQPRDVTIGHARRAVMCLVNNQRKNRGIQALHHDRRLQRASQKHNDRMVSKGCFSHQCSGESALDSRLRSVGYLKYSLSRWAYGENIGWGGDRLATPRSMVKAWMNSPGHRANILNPSFRDLGVGYTKGRPGRKGDRNAATFTTDFGLRVG